MKNATRDNFGTTAPFTIAVLEKLKHSGFQYVQVKGFTSERKLDYMEPRYLVLIPMKELPPDEGKIEIYESINSKMLMDWATHSQDGMEVLVLYNEKF